MAEEDKINPLAQENVTESQTDVSVVKQEAQTDLSPKQADAKRTTENMLNQVETPAPQTSNNIITPETKEMEVHKHPHHVMHKKKWGEYLLEFFMLFLAVFLGFLAENIREQSVEKHQEKEYIKSLVEDLKQDTISFSKNGNDLNLVLEKDDSLIQLLNSPEVKNYGAALYYMGRLSSRNYPVIVNDATIQQLKNSGGFRLIRGNNIAKNIVEYYNRLVFIKHLQDVELLQGQDYRQLAIEVFDPLIFNSIIDRRDNSVFRPAGNPALLTYDIQILRRLSGLVSYHKNSQLGLSQSQRNMKKAAAELIALIQKEYHLENE